MPWARLDDDFHDNGKILSLSHQAFRLYVCAITYSRRHRTEGGLTAAQVGALCRQQRIKPTAIAELVAATAWHVAPPGYRIHDFGAYQPRDDETAADRMRRYRERRKASRSGDVTEHTVTPGDGSVTRNGDAPVPIPMVIATSPQTEHLPQEDTSWHDTHMAISRSPGVGARPARTSKNGYTPEFEAWWSVYPRHDGKLPASLAYRDRLKAGRSPHELAEAAHHFAGHHEAAATPTEKIPHGSTWLHQHRDEEWEHGPPDADRVVAPQRSGPAPKLAETAAGLRQLKHLRELNGDKRTSFFDLATAGVSLPDAGGAPPNPGALPGPPGGASLA